MDKITVIIRFKNEEYKTELPFIPRKGDYISVVIKEDGYGSYLQGKIKKIYWHFDELTDYYVSIKL